MVRKILLLFAFNICLFAIYGQQDTLKYFISLPRLEVINKQIYQVLDSAISYNKNCIYAIRDKPYYFEIKILEGKNDTIDIFVGTDQYPAVIFNKEWAGYFYYEDNLIFVKESNFLFFGKEIQEDMQTFYYKDYYPYLAHHFKSYEYMRLYYQYINNEFIPKHKRLCKELPYYHLVNKTGGTLDTWESIADKYEITVEELKSLNKKKRNKPLKLRDEIRVH